MARTHLPTTSEENSEFFRGAPPLRGGLQKRRTQLIAEVLALDVKPLKGGCSHEKIS